MSFSPYLFFSGNCAEAFEHYRVVFDGQLDVMRNAEAPEGAGMPDVDPDTVMHAALRLGDTALLMGSDDPTGTGGPKLGFAVSYSAPDDAEARRVFDALAEDGEITMEYTETFWSVGFGMCTDRFGVSWMVDVAGEPPAV